VVSSKSKRYFYNFDDMLKLVYYFCLIDIDKRDLLVMTILQDIDMYIKNESIFSKINAEEKSLLATYFSCLIFNEKYKSLCTFNLIEELPEKEDLIILEEKLKQMEKLIE